MIPFSPLKQQFNFITLCSICAIHHYSYCIPRTKYVRGILWFSRRYAATSAFHRLRDTLKKPYRIASIFYM